MEKDKLFAKSTLLFSLGCLAVNLLGVRLVTALELPIFLDSLGTLLAGALGGYLPGIIVGFLSNVIVSISDPITLYYGLLNIAFGILAAYLSQCGVFRSFGKTLVAMLGFAFIGGVLGSMMTWALYGFDFGEGISAPFAMLLHDSFGVNRFFAQLGADFALDLLDKCATVLLLFPVLSLLPKKLLQALPLGRVYLKSDAGALTPLEELSTLPHRNTRVSLRIKVAFIIIVTAAILSALAVGISTIIYQDTMNERYKSLCDGAVNLMLMELDGDRIDAYLAEGEAAEGYLLTKQRLAAIRSSFPDVQYLYVYRILEDGCHVVFDVDTPELPGAKPGELIDFDPDFLVWLPTLLAGGEIEPIVSDAQYGWLLSVYKPVRDSEGNCVAYAAADVSMERIISDRYTFAIRIFSLLLGVSVIFVAFTLWFAQQRVVLPINQLTAAASKFAYDSDEGRQETSERLRSLKIDTGDEIQNLYTAVAKTVTDVANYIDLIREKNEEVASKAKTIQRMQNSIILAFANMIENRDENTGEHVQHTAAYVEAIGRALSKNPKYSASLTPEYLDNLHRSAPLHDIGKVRISDVLLNKPGRLTPEEFELIKTHTTAGGEILRGAFAGIEGENYLSEAIDMAVYHHERWDGTGYPQRLRGEEIPLCARIMAVADVFDALVSKRSYKKPYSFDEALDILRAESGSHFDPAVVEAFLSVAEDLRGYAEKAADGTQTKTKEQAHAS